MRSRMVWELGELGGIDEILQAEDVSSALTLLESHRPEVAVLDLHLRKELALPILETIRERHLPTSAIVFSNDAAGPLKESCLELGASACLPKGNGFEDVLRAVSQILSSLHSSRPESSAAPQNLAN